MQNLPVLCTDVMKLATGPTQGLTLRLSAPGPGAGGMLTAPPGAREPAEWRLTGGRAARGLRNAPELWRSQTTGSAARAASPLSLKDKSKSIDLSEGFVILQKQLACGLFLHLPAGPIKLTSLACGNQHIWACDSRGGVYFRVGTQPLNPSLMLPAWIMIEPPVQVSQP